MVSTMTPRDNGAFIFLQTHFPFPATTVNGAKINPFRQGNYQVVVKVVRANSIGDNAGMSETVKFNNKGTYLNLVDQSSEKFEQNDLFYYLDESTNNEWVGVFCASFAVGMEPYCVIEMDEPPQKHTTSVVKNLSSNPVWEERFTLYVSHAKKQL